MLTNLLLTSITTLLIIILIRCEKVIQALTNVPMNADRTSDEHIQELSSYDVDKLERDKAFDERIAQLKEELASQQPTKPSDERVGTPAEELHPLVHNLPHDTVKNYYDSPLFEEVAE